MSKISIIMATYNRANFIEQAIQSVLQQTFSDWELIIVDDGSIDNTRKVVEKWQSLDSRIKYICLEHVGKIASVTNIGLKQANGDFVAILDDDDYWIDKEKLEKQYNFLNSHPDYVACGGGLVIIDKEGKKGKNIFKPETDESIRKIATMANPIVNSSSLFRREIGGLYDQDLPQLADWDFWLRIGQKGKLYNFPEIFIAYRVWDQNISFLKQKEHAVSMSVVIKRYIKLYPNYFGAIFMFIIYRIYVFIPFFIRKKINIFFSKVKKSIFV